MNKLLLDPVILFLCPVLFIIIYIILIRIGDRKEASANIERIFIVIFIIIVAGNSVLPLSYLNPAVLPLPTTKLSSPTFLAQLFFYSLTAFLLRSRFTYLFSSIGNLLRNPFLGVLLLLTALSAFWSETPEVTLKAGLILLGYAVFASYIASRYTFQEIANLLQLAGTFITISGALAALLVPSIGRAPEGGEWQGLLLHKNAFAFSMALTSALWFLHAINHPKHRLVSIGLAMLSLFVMLPAGSGTSKLMFFLMILALLMSQLLQHLRRLSFRKATVITMFSTIFLGTLTVILSASKAAVLGVLGKDASLTGRTDFWPQVIHHIGQKPLLGYGYGGFWQSWRGYENPARSIIVGGSQFVPPNAHNGYLEIALATGYIGATLFALATLTILFKLLIFSLRSRKGEAEIAIMMLIFSLLSSFSESNIWAMNNYTFLFFLTSTRLCVDVASKPIKNTNFTFSSPVI